jgi:hypothetical protein
MQYINIALLFLCAMKKATPFKDVAFEIYRFNTSN